jgi:hypothetical protein
MLCYTWLVTYSLHARLLSKLAELLGGRAPLGHQLQVPAQNLARWMAGSEPMPSLVFLKVVDLIIELTSEPLSSSGDVRRMDRRTKGGERDALR